MLSTKLIATKNTMLSSTLSLLNIWPMAMAA